MPITAAFFDLDHTLYEGFFGEALFRHHMKHRMKLGQLLKYLAIHYPMVPLARMGLYSYEKAYNNWGENLSWLLKGVKVSEAENIWTWIVENRLFPNIRPSMREALSIHKARGEKVVFISGSFEEIVKKLADELDADDLIATKLDVRENFYTGKIVSPLNVGSEKLRNIEKYAENNGINLGNSTFYSDSIVDLPAMELVGNAIAVHPDEDLRKTAQARGWKIIE